MLVLSRRKDESFEARITREQALAILSKHPFISLKVLVVELRSGLVRLGVDAPKSVPIHRSEVWGQIEAGETVATR